MALPNSPQEPPSSASGTAPTPFLTWARVAQPQRVSLVHQYRKKQTPDQKMTTFLTRIWRIGRTPGSVLFDVSPIPGSVPDFIQKIMNVFPTNNGILVHREGKRTVLEVKLKNQEENDPPYVNRTMNLSTGTSAITSANAGFKDVPD
ncbi:hypothetical protein BDB00DRAFT_879379 [Zychaea mexicana]|uniref:uncharacterized protein n=1 Tax=Zychaea mexicana TaxID=64656 RepID=UPI0022FF4289|nr:uncharacterized protein BDB00DRAFT_879379 [Zychaea mexicana]KAI9478920.1 hypothetical protein BDB00DRAFT_879379 [Zychaea mexicana]